MTWYKCMGGGDNVVTISKSDYDALPTAEKNNGKVYKVTIPATGTPGLISLNHFNESFNNDECGIQWTSYAGNGYYPVISPLQKKFGDASLYLNCGPFLRSEQSDKIRFEDNDFTIDAWLYPTSQVRSTFFSYGLPESGGISYAVDLMYYDMEANMWMSTTGNTWDVVNADPGGNGIGTKQLTLNAWNHVALVRNSTKLSLYVNGELSVEATIPADAIAYPDSRQGINIGAWDNLSYGYIGYIDEFCIRNYAVWTDDFTPPTQPYEKYIPAHDVLYFMSTEYDIETIPIPPDTGMFKEFFAIDSSTVRTQYNWRTYKKYDDTLAAVCCFYYEANGSIWCHPMCLLSETANGATYQVDDPAIIQAINTITVGDTTLYYAEPGYLFEAYSDSWAVSNFPIAKINTFDTPYASYEAGVGAFAELALKD